MLKLIGPYIFIVAGVVVGVITTMLFNNPMRFGANILAGIAGSFLGLFVRDIFDINIGGNLSGALLAAVVGALVLTVGLNLWRNHQEKL